MEAGGVLRSTPSTMSRMRLSHFHEPDDVFLKLYIWLNTLLKLCLIITTIGGLVVFVTMAHLQHTVIHYIQEYLVRAKDDLNFYSSSSELNQDILPLLEEANNDDVYIGRWVRILSSFGYTTSLLIWTTSIAGCLSIYEKNVMFVACFILSNFVNIAWQAFIAIILYDWDSGFHKGTVDELASLVEQIYQFGDDSDFAKMLNSAMVLGECCGIKGPGDFGRLGYKDTAEATHKFQFSPACCKKSLWVEDSNQTYTNLMECLTGGVSEDNDLYNSRGCNDSWAKLYIENDSAFIIYFPVSILAAVQLVQAIVGMFFMRWATFKHTGNAALDKDDLDTPVMSVTEGLRDYRMASIATLAPQECLVGKTRLGIPPMKVDHPEAKPDNLYGRTSTTV